MLGMVSILKWDEVDAKGRGVLSIKNAFFCPTQHPLIMVNGQ